MKRHLRNQVLALMALALPAQGQVACNGATEGYLLNWSDHPVTAGTTAASIDVIRDGELSGTSASEPVQVDFAFSGATYALEAGQPTNSNFLTGGNGTAESSYSWIIDLNQTDDTLVLTIDFERVVYDLDFDLFDIDILWPSDQNGQTTGGFRDNVVVTGYNTTANTTILPALSTPYLNGTQGQVAPSTVYIGNPLAANRAIANPSNNNGNSNPDEDLGNMDVTFSSGVNRVVIEYTTPSDYFNSVNPQRQAIGIYDLDFCVPRGANLTYDKTVALHSETSEDCANIPGTPQDTPEAAIPGACLEYTITIGNVGSGPSTNTTISDTLNQNMIFAAASHTGFDTSDPAFDFQVPTSNTDCGSSSCLVRMEGATIPSGGAGFITVRTVLK